jgi:hypothetical protein
VTSIAITIVGKEITIRRAIEEKKANLQTQYKK